MRFKLINLNRYLADGNSLNLEFPSVFYPSSSFIKADLSIVFSSPITYT